MRLPFLLFTGCCLGLSWVPLAAAAPPSADAVSQADALHKQGTEHLAAGRYAEAAASYLAAYAKNANPNELYNAGRSQLLALHYREALELFTTYQNLPSTERIDEAHRAEARSLADECARHLCRLEVRDARDVRIDGQPGSASTFVEPGAHRVVFADARGEKGVTCRAGETVVVGESVAAPAPGPPRAQATAARDGRPLVVGLVGGVGVASLGAGLVTMLLARGAQGDMRDPARSRTERSDSRGSYDSLRTVSTVTTWTGAALVVGAGATWLLWPHKQIEVGAVRIAPTLGVSSVGLSGWF